jgi:hypothetical protein
MYQGLRRDWQKMKTLNEFIETAVEKISGSFPDVAIYSDYYYDPEEVFILIDDKQTYENKDFRHLVMLLRDEQPEDSSVFFVYINSLSELTENAKTLFTPRDIKKIA